MRATPHVLTAGFAVALCLAAAAACAQQVTIGTPFHTLSDNFFERMGVDFGMTLRSPGNPQLAGWTFTGPQANGQSWIAPPPGSPTSIVGLLGVGNSPANPFQGGGIFSPSLGIPFGQGSFAQGVPQFGDPKTGVGLQNAFSIVGPRVMANFAFDLSQGNSRSSVTQTPSVTLINGQQGFVSDTSQTPFVMSVIPVVGAFPAVRVLSPVPTPQQLADAAGMPLMSGNPRVQAMRDAAAAAAADDQPGALAMPPQGAGQQPAGQTARPRRAAPEPVVAEEEGPAGRLAAAQDSTAGRPAPSVAEARRVRAQEDDAEQEKLKALFERGLAAEEAGQPGVAKVYYQQVARRASGDLKDRALERLDALRGTSPSR
jgi:hypothetical protein